MNLLFDCYGQWVWYPHEASSLHKMGHMERCLWACGPGGVQRSSSVALRDKGLVRTTPGVVSTLYGAPTTVLRTSTLITCRSWWVQV